MAKRYSKELESWLKAAKGNKNRRGKHLVAFLVIKDDVQDALEAGYSIKSIWEHMKETGKLSCRYETFLKHVNDHLKKAGNKTKSSSGVKRAKPGHSNKLPNATSTAKEERCTQSRKDTAAFKINHTLTKKDLI